MTGDPEEQAFEAAGGDPRTVLRQLQSMGDLREVGRSEIRDVEVTELAGELDFVTVVRAPGAPECSVTNRWVTMPR
jgi:hypothetical protein